MKTLLIFTDGLETYDSVDHELLYMLGSSNIFNYKTKAVDVNIYPFLVKESSILGDSNFKNYYSDKYIWSPSKIISNFINFENRKTSQFYVNRYSHYLPFQDYSWGILNIFKQDNFLKTAWNGFFIDAMSEVINFCEDEVMDFHLGLKKLDMSFNIFTNYIRPSRLFYRNSFESNVIYKRHMLPMNLNKKNINEASINNNLFVYFNNSKIKKGVINVNYNDSYYYQKRFQHLLRICAEEPNSLNTVEYFPWDGRYKHVIIDFSLPCGALGWHSSFGLSLISESYPEGAIFPLNFKNLFEVRQISSQETPVLFGVMNKEEDPSRDIVGSEKEDFVLFKDFIKFNSDDYQNIYLSYNVFRDLIDKTEDDITNFGHYFASDNRTRDINALAYFNYYEAQENAKKDNKENKILVDLKHSKPLDNYLFGLEFKVSNFYENLYMYISNLIFFKEKIVVFLLTQILTSLILLSYFYLNFLLKTQMSL